MEHSKYVLDIEDLWVRYRTKDATVNAINGIDLKIRSGQTLGFVGETGAGKTTTALSILRLIQSPPGEVTRGRILLNGKNVMEMSSAELRNMRGNDVSMIFQDPMTSLDPVLPVGMQIAEGIREHDRIGRAEAFKRACEMLEMVGISSARRRLSPPAFRGHETKSGHRDCFGMQSQVAHC